MHQHTKHNPFSLGAQIMVGHFQAALILCFKRVTSSKYYMACCSICLSFCRCHFLQQWLSLVPFLVYYGYVLEHVVFQAQKLQMELGMMPRPINAKQGKGGCYSNFFFFSAPKCSTQLFLLHNWHYNFLRQNFFISMLSTEKNGPGTRLF